jgi:hypothetical protein
VSYVPLTAGAHNVTGVYTGDPSHIGGSGFFHVEVSDFTITVSSRSLTLAPGVNGTSTITIAPINGFTRTVSLEIAASGGLTSVTLNSTSVAGSGSVTLAVNAANAGDYSVVMNATSGPLYHVAPAITVHVVGFRVFVQTSFTDKAGYRVVSEIKVWSLNGFSGMVKLKVGASPAGATVSLTPSAIDLASGAAADVTLMIDLSPTIPPGSYTITLDEMGGGISRQATLDLTVTSPTTPTPPQPSPTRSPTANLWPLALGLVGLVVGLAAWLAFKKLKIGSRLLVVNRKPSALGLSPTDR